MDVLPGYLYLDWARFGPGSKVFFDGPPGEELSFALAELDGGKAVLEIATDHLGATTELGKPDRLVLPAHPRYQANSPDIPAEALEWLREHQPQMLAKWKNSLRSDEPAMAVVDERKEIIDVLGEDRLCRRIERRREGSEPATLWLLDEVPGGVVRWQVGGATWRLRSFESK